jgi:hypothetical protein
MGRVNIEINVVDHSRYIDKVGGHLINLCIISNVDCRIDAVFLNSMWWSN